MTLGATAESVPSLERLEDLPSDRLGAVLLLCTAWMVILSALGGFYSASSVLRTLSIALGVLLFLAMCHLKKDSRVPVAVALLAGAALPFAILAGPRTGWKSISIPACLLSQVGVAWFAVSTKVTRQVYEWPFFAYLAACVALVAAGFGPEQFNSLFAGASRNGVSAILVLFAVGYLVSSEFRGVRPSLWPLIAAFLLSFPMFGRSSIVALALILLLVSGISRPRLAIALFVLACGAFAVYEVWLSDAIRDLSSKTNFRSGLISARWKILEDYLAAIDPVTFFGGADMRRIDSIVLNDGSPDIAYVRLHSFIGVGAFVLLGCSVYSLGSSMARARPYLFIALLAVLFRACTDVIMFIGTLDYTFMPALLVGAFSVYLPPATWRTGGGAVVST